VPPIVVATTIGAIRTQGRSPDAPIAPGRDRWHGFEATTAGDIHAAMSKRSPNVSRPSSLTSVGVKRLVGLRNASVSETPNGGGVAVYHDEPEKDESALPSGELTSPVLE